MWILPSSPVFVYNWDPVYGTSIICLTCMRWKDDVGVCIVLHQLNVYTGNIRATLHTGLNKNKLQSDFPRPIPWNQA